MPDIQKQLLGMKRRFCLTTSDLAVLLGINRSTVLAWEKGVKPSNNKVPLVQKKIDTILGVRAKFPVPLDVTQYQRKTYLLDAVNGRASRVSFSRSSSGGSRA